jgi:hypothetical protein
VKPAPIYFLITFSVLCMATASIIIRYSSAAPMVIGFYRVLFTAILASFLGGRGILTECHKLRKKDYLLISGAGKLEPGWRYGHILSSFPWWPHRTKRQPAMDMYKEDKRMIGLLWQAD